MARASKAGVRSGNRDIFDPNHERDACGVGFVADVEGRASHSILETAVYSLCRVRHRGALDADGKSGDGAGILTSLPTEFFAAEAARMGTPADPAFIGVAVTFVWSDGHRSIIEEACRWEGIEVLGWRTVPIDAETLGDRAKATQPLIEQAIFLKPIGVDAAEAERRCVRARKRAEKGCAEVGIRVYFPSFSFSTITYKGMCLADKLADFYLDLGDERYSVPLAIFHQRFSTNTLPTWERVQPFRMLCHNGEINTIQGNVNRMRAREGRLGKINLLEEELLRPVIDTSGSDSAMLDNVLELITREGRDVRHAAAMLIPAAWETLTDIGDEVRDFYRYHACLVEAWDGPAGVIFTDGVRVGAVLDRNGLRPMRYVVCEDGLIACTSEAGSVYTRGHGRVRRGKLGPGQMICVDPPTGGGSGFEENPVRDRLAKARPYGTWVEVYLKPAPLGEPNPEIPADLVRRQVVFGYSHEDFTTVIRPMATSGHEPTSSMGDDTAPGGLANHSRPVYNYFKQRFAQVTNPPMDPIRERGVMSIRTLIGPHDPVLWERPEGASLLELETFLLFKAPGGYRLDATFPVADGPAGLRAGIERLAGEAEHAAGLGSGILVISDRDISASRAPIPMLLAVGATHQRLLQTGQRTRVSIVVETDEAREVHHLACLLGYGAEAVCPSLVLASIADLVHKNRLGEDISVAEALMRFRNAVEEGVLKILSKMGISTTDSYRGAQIFDAVGLGYEVVDLCFTGCASPLGGIGFETLATDVLARHRRAFDDSPKLVNPGYYKHHAKGIEHHVTNPGIVDSLQEAVQNGDWEAYSTFAKLVAERPPTEPRDLLEVVAAGPPLPVEEVEPLSAITRRFSSGAISHGAIGKEAHETIAQAMNLVGGKANTGEGGEDRSRYDNDKNCRIKQIASGRFGVTPEYCSFAEELNIKMAQGSKPGEGGQIPGKKVTEEIAGLRHTQPGVALISPPPHHDIYSIEDLAQLIFDLKQVNPKADVSVKLVSEAGVGTIAAGVAKALADVVQICGWDGGTGASPLSSIKNAGLPWEIGLAETQQVLMENGLRDRVRVRMDGGLKSGRDVLMAALLGADEYSFGTSLLLAEGCIMVRACHRDTCPVGIATQRMDLRAKFAGTPQRVATYLNFVGEEVRRLLASLGLRSLNDAIGRVDLLRPRALPGHRAEMLDLSMLVEAWEGPRHFVAAHPIQRPRSELGDRLFEDAFEKVMAGEEIFLDYPIHNSDRTIGARLGGAIAHVHAAAPPPGKVHVDFTGEAGQSFGAFLTEGIDFRLLGEANDYVGKGMGGGRIVIIAPEDDAGDPYLLGNTCLYGATGGRLFVAGRAGERFCVRNSGATTVIEGAGDHACEYMTGGTVVILGPTGWNLGAGMTGGQAYVYDPDLRMPARVNPELVSIAHPDGPQQTFLRGLVAQHAELTGSQRSAALLEDWKEQAHKFWRIAPKAEVAKIEGSHEGS
ncbi:MAG TPA: glutamate synthase large subunit, partial [Actinomycetota bacterium]|nr:glutamate synthase large subunit [Actinomycetota bacterium]